MFSGILFLHLRGVLCCASQSGLRECLYNVWQLHVREKVISRRFPPVTKVKLNGVFHPIQRTLVFTTKFILALYTIYGAGGAESHQCHQGCAIERKEGGHILSPVFRQQGFKTFFF
ncbi:Uncharacterised protein [Klebsiella pneumoniae]|nr:Uncharacterised protein [Klebsiella pneumoniae]SLT18195.1 Uncharacterised protein [Klebsiella pneumoniae]SWC09632.1 Uncharacterised protein [Klebsiella pneumoniae]